MKFTLLTFVTLLLITISCGQEPTGTPRFIRTIMVMKQTPAFRQYFERSIDALDWIKRQPQIKTTGIDSSLYADELGVHPSVWGRVVNNESDLTTVRVSSRKYYYDYGEFVSDTDEPFTWHEKQVRWEVAEGVIKLIFRQGFTPKEQVASAIKKFPAKQFEQEGVPIEKIAKHVHFRQSGWSDQGFHRAIGRYLDKKKFVTQQIERKTVIFRKGFTPVNR